VTADGPEGGILRTLAHYEVFEQIGAGGMGTVFRARDTRLGRDVVLKLLPAALFADEGARRRLEQEARLASSLNHPHVCTIYEVGEAGDETYVAMELVGGGPLNERIPPGGLPVETVLRYGIEIADALAHAHEHGVLHRDLKSANVAITADGRTKVLDFGLARRTAGIAGDVTRTASPTATAEGSVAGTPSHLAPELLRGGVADERSDLWALSVLLYEMASGALPFSGRTEFERSAAILNDPPAKLPERVPPGVRAVILRGLEKDPRHRYPRASEVRAALEALRSDLHAPVAASPRIRRPTPRSVALGALMIVLAVAVAWLALERPWVRHELGQRQLTTNPAGDPIVYGVLSPDGKTLAYVHGEDLQLRAIDSGESHPIALPSDLVLAGQVIPLVCWRPDGTQLLVSGHTRAGEPCEWAIPILGGRAHEVLHGGFLATPSPDGSRLAWVRPNPDGDEIWCSGPNGESARRIVASDTSGILTAWATWSPHGDRIAYGRGLFDPAGVRMRIETSDLAGHRRTILTDSAEQTLHTYTVPLWLPDGRLMFCFTDPKPNQGDMNLWALHVDPRTGAPSGKPRRVTQWQNLSLLLPTAVSADGKHVSVATLHYQSDCYIGRIAGGDSSLDQVERLTLDDRMDISPSWTPDSRAILFASDRSGSLDLFRQAMGERDAEPLVTERGNQNLPITSPDGAWILYLETKPGPTPAAPTVARIMRVPTAGGAPEPVLNTQPAAKLDCATQPASLCVLSELDHGETVFTAFDPKAGRGQELTRVKGACTSWDLSPDGTSIAYLPLADSIAAIRTIPTRGRGPKAVRLDHPYGLQSVTWAADGRRWYVIGVGEQSDWYVLRVDPSGRTVKVTPRQLWMYGTAPSPDGRRLAYTSNTIEGNVWLLEGF
jgi:serine/threonine protein kinase/Tol biopolymer transport system component